MKIFKLSNSTSPTRRAAKATIAAVAVLLCSTQAAHAIDVDPGDFIPGPPGTNIGLFYLQGAQRNSLYAGSQRVPGSNGLDSQIGILRGLHFTEFAGMPVGLNVVLPFGHLEGKDGASFLGSASGAADAAFVATVWPLSDHQTGTYVSVANYLFLPTGKYDRQKALNLGENRWKYIIQPNTLFRVNSQWAFDLIGDLTIYGRNDEFGAGPTAQVMKQKPSVQLQAFSRYALSPTATLHAGLSWMRTGSTEVAGVNSNDAGRVSKFQVGGAVFVAPKTQLMLAVGRDIKVSGDSGALLFKENARLNLRLLQIF